MSNREEIIESITSDVSFMSKWRSIVKDGTLDRILELCNCYRAPYNKDAKPDPMPHIQAEFNGGMKSWDKLEYLLSSLAFRENNRNNKHGEEYVGYVRDHVAKRRQIDFEEKYDG
jgi:hypothetical protein